MSKILVIDIETTGFSSRKDKIVEIAIAELDLMNCNIEILFDHMVREITITVNEFVDSWIFKTSDMKLNDMTGANTLTSYFDEIQEIINSNPLGLTAFNNAFDFRFLENRGFIIPRKLRDPMSLSKNICRIPGKRSGYKMPNVEEAYNHFYPNDNYIETHRAADDAKHEAKIIYSLYKLGVF